MKIRELKGILDGYPDDAEVYLSNSVSASPLHPGDLTRAQDSVDYVKLCRARHPEVTDDWWWREAVEDDAGIVIEGT